MFLLGCALLVGTACGDGDERLAAQQERLEAEHQARMAELEALEIRLITVGARQRAWSELQDRHTRVSAIACEQAAAHVSAMERHDEKQREKRQRARSRRLAGAQARVETKQVDTVAGEASAARN